MSLPPGWFAKYHALGNDYLVVAGSPAGGGAAAQARSGPWGEALHSPAPGAAAPAGSAEEGGRPRLPDDGPGLSPGWVRAACARQRGVGADGVLLLAAAAPASGCDARLRIYNPDGGEAERSGNGLRIAAQALFDLGYLPPPRLRLWTASGAVAVRQLAGPLGRRPAVLEVAMGPPCHGLAAVGGRPRPDDAASALTQVALEVAGEHLCLPLALVSVGNPHAVWWRPALDAALFDRWAAAVSRAPIFPRRINVQMAAAEGRQRVRVQIWERGVGPTQASGSSACAVAATAWQLGLCDAPLTVAMPGGELVIDRTPTGSILLRGPVQPVCVGRWPEGGLPPGEA